MAGMKDVLGQRAIKTFALAKLMGAAPAAIVREGGAPVNDCASCAWERVTASRQILDSFHHKAVLVRRRGVCSAVDRKSQCVWLGHNDGSRGRGDAEKGKLANHWKVFSSIFQSKRSSVRSFVCESCTGSLRFGAKTVADVQMVLCHRLNPAARRSYEVSMPRLLGA
jgi:hypothetical protein